MEDHGRVQGDARRRWQVNVSNEPRSTSKWQVEKCRRRRGVWHVYAPRPDEDAFCPDYEFSTGTKALEYVAMAVTNARLDHEGNIGG